MPRRIVIIQGHPDPAGHHLLHAIADAYAEGAVAMGYEVRRIEVANLVFPLLRTQVDFKKDAVPPALVGLQDDMRWAEHWVFMFPLWHWNHTRALEGLSRTHFPPRLRHGICQGCLARSDRRAL